jgi:hypothetical protein
MEENNKLVLAEDINTAEPQEAPASPARKKLPLTHSLPAKVAAFILAVIAAFALFGSAVLGLLAFESNFYTMPKEEVRKNYFKSQIISDASDAANELYHDSINGKDTAREIVESKNFSYITIDFSEDIVNKTWTYKSDKEAGSDTFSFYLYNFDDHFITRSPEGAAGAKGNAKINAALTKDFTSNDKYALINNGRSHASSS